MNRIFYLTFHNGYSLSILRFKLFCVSEKGLLVIKEPYLDPIASGQIANPRHWPIMMPEAGARLFGILLQLGQLQGSLEN